MTPRVGVYTPWGLEFTRQRPTHSLEEELVLCVSASVSFCPVCSSVPPSIPRVPSRNTGSVPCPPPPPFTSCVTLDAALNLCASVRGECAHSGRSDPQVAKQASE